MIIIVILYILLSTSCISDKNYQKINQEIPACICPEYQEPIYVYECFSEEDDGDY